MEITTLTIFVIALTVHSAKAQGLGSVNQFPSQPINFVAPLTSEAYSEGACIVPQVATNTDPNWIVNQKTFYVPISSQFSYRRFAETLLSRSPTSESELQSMCLTIEAVQAGRGLNLTNLGYDDREFRQTCTVNSPGLFSCSAIGSSAGVNPSKQRSAEDYIVSVDNRSYMLIVRCVDGFFRDYQLLTARPTVSQELYNIVLNATRNLGFDERRLQFLSYDNCLRTPLNLISSSNLAQLRSGNTIRRSSGPLYQFSNTAYAAPYANNININNQQPQQQQTLQRQKWHQQPQQQQQQQYQLQPQQYQQVQQQYQPQQLQQPQLQPLQQRQQFQQPPPLPPQRQQFFPNNDLRRSDPFDGLPIPEEFPPFGDGPPGFPQPPFL